MRRPHGAIAPRPHPCLRSFTVQGPAGPAAPSRRPVRASEDSRDDDSSTVACSALSRFPPPAGVVELAGPELAELAAVPPARTRNFLGGRDGARRSRVLEVLPRAVRDDLGVVSFGNSGLDGRPEAVPAALRHELAPAVEARRSFLGLAVVLTREVAPCLGHDVEAAVQRGIRLDPVEQRDLEAVDEILARRRPSEAPTGCSTKRACVQGRGRKTIGFGRRRYRRPAGAGSSQWRLALDRQGLRIRRGAVDLPPGPRTGPAFPCSHTRCTQRRHGLDLRRGQHP